MFYLSENLRKYRIIKNLTQEEVAGYLRVTPQSVSKWERGECYPDITLLPALANVFETSVDLLLGMDSIRAEETRHNIHDRAHKFMSRGELEAAERVYRDALLIYPNKPEMMLGLAEVLALAGKDGEAIELILRGLPISENEKQKATARALLCFLYLRLGDPERARAQASSLPHARESREVILPLVAGGLRGAELDGKIREILLGE